MKVAHSDSTCKRNDVQRERAAPIPSTDSPHVLPKEFVSLGDALRLIRAPRLVRGGADA